MPPSDHQLMKCHMIFDVQMEDLFHKALLVARGHMTKAPKTLTYASIMSQETIRIALLVAVLNDIDIWAADILNDWITMPCNKKIWTTLGKEFGDDCGQKAIIVRALYVLKSSGAALRAHLAGCLCKLGYRSCLDELTCGSRIRQMERQLCIMDKIESFLSLMPDSIAVLLRCILGISSRRRLLKMAQWLGV
ncbi:hypothetical protein ACHAW6_005712 [Cyclotella cf. meneghiniana]